MSNCNRDKLVVQKVFKKQYWLQSKLEEYPSKPAFTEPLKDSRYRHIYDRVRYLQRKYCPKLPLLTVPRVEIVEPLFPVDIFNNITLKERGFVSASLKNAPASREISIPITRPSRDEPEEPWKLSEEERKRIAQKIPVRLCRQVDILYGRLLTNLCDKSKKQGLWNVSLREMFGAIQGMDDSKKVEDIDLMDLIPALVFSQKNIATWSTKCRRGKAKVTDSGDSGCQPSTSCQDCRCHLKYDVKVKEMPHEYVIIQSDPEWTLYGTKS